MGSIYKITNKINKKVYIGKTENSIRLRFNQHLKEAERNVANSKLYGSIRKYGGENFEIVKIAFSNNSKELSKLEKFFIKEYKSRQDKFGYNITIGGDGLGKGKNHPNFGKKNPSASIWMKELNKQISPMRDEEILNKHWRGKNHPYHRNKKIREGLKKAVESRAKLCSKPINQICSNTGKVLAKFASIAAAKRHIGKGDIQNCLLGFNETAGGFKWKYVK